MKHLFLALLLSTALLPSVVFAQIPQPSPGDIVPVDEATVGNFQPITSLPVFGSIGDIGRVDLASFFNQLYVLAVGAAAIVAVAQIMLAGFQLAIAQGSHSAIGEARSKITNAVLGLLLILSPTIVFGVINPDILNLRIDTGLLTDRNPVAEQADGGTFDPDNIAITLRGNKWGTLDNVCDFGADGIVETLTTSGGFKIKEQIGIKKFGNGISINQGRQCCALSSGEITTIEGDSTVGTQEICDLSSVIEGGRYIAHVDAVVTRLFEDGGGIVKGESREAHFFSPGAGTGSWNAVGDVDTMIIHGFRSRSACESFINGLTEASLTTHFKNRLKFSPSIGLLEAQNSTFSMDKLFEFQWGKSEEMLPSKMASVDSITKRWCDEIRFGKK